MVNWEDKRIVDLYSKFSAKIASAIELEEFNAFLNTSGAEQRLFELLETDYQLSDSYEKDISEFRALQIFEAVTSQPQEVKKVTRLWPRMAGVAAIAAIIAFSILLRNNYLNDRSHLISITAAQDIAPGTNTATLTLGNGRKIILSAALNGVLAAESGVRISKTADGEITYEIVDNGLTEQPGINVLATDRGETYRVKLPDGSLVWLNAASTLAYPASFDGKETRKVKMSGEAYFEVVSDKKRPFIVETKGQDVTVLGTQFNIKAYQEEKEVVTTLQEGSVRVDFQAAAWSNNGKLGYKDEIVLRPGQQSLLRGESISIAKANLEENIAWKEGDFIFTEVGIERVLRDIARWYNIEVVYEGSIPVGTFSGNISRTKNISQILLALESTKLVHFKIEGRKVYVRK